MADTVRVFVSYSHADARYLKKNSLLGYLRGLENENVEFRQFQDLREVLQETLDTPALVLLGPPGSGKSTLLLRLEWDLTVDALRDRVAAASRRCTQSDLAVDALRDQVAAASRRCNRSDLARVRS